MLKTKMSGVVALLLVTVFVLFISPVTSVLADVNYQDLGTPFYDPASAATGCTSGSTNVLSGSDNPQKVWNYFKDKGLSDSQVAGIMGNLQQEASFDPQRIQNGGDSQNPVDAGGGGWGIIQWTPGSKITGLAQQAGVIGPIYELSTQLDLLWQHMNNHPPVTGTFDINHYKQITSEVEASQYFLSQIEGGTDPNNIRETYATDWLQRYSGSGGAGAVDKGCGVSVSPDCQSAQGSAKILCAAKAYDTVSYSESVQGGHQGGAAWHASCPVIGPSCALDCSGLVNLSVYDAFGVDLKENTYSEVLDSANWQRVTASQIQPGDLIQPGPLDGGHVEIIDHVAGNRIYTFGSHSPNTTQAKQVGPSSFVKSDGDVYLHYVGQGSS